jgi:hypothetical protein
LKSGGQDEFVKKIAQDFLSKSVHNFSSGEKGSLKTSVIFIKMPRVIHCPTITKTPKRIRIAFFVLGGTPAALELLSSACAIGD